LHSNPNAKEENFQSHTSGDHVLRDFCDGSFVSQNKIFRAHKDGLQLIFYYDDIEVANLLASKAEMHKLVAQSMHFILIKITRIILLCASVQYLGQHCSHVGGFKEGVGLALRKCQKCMTSSMRVVVYLRIIIILVHEVHFLIEKII